MKKLLYFFLFITISVQGQHFSKLNVVLNDTLHTLEINQEITYFNQTNDTLSSIVLNDWNHAYSDKNSPLGKRFSDEFVRNFHLASESERGKTLLKSIQNEKGETIDYKRVENHLDLIEILIRNKILPFQKIVLKLNYILKIPSSKFTDFGVDSNGNYILKNWFLTPALYENGSFVTYSNLNLDDIANANSDYELELSLPTKLVPTCDLNLTSSTTTSYNFQGKNKADINLFIEKKNSFQNYVNADFTVVSNINSSKVDEISKAQIINKVVDFVAKKIGNYPHQKIIISQLEYDRNPFYGLNQLPSFLSPFSNDFLYELKILKTYLSSFLKTSMQIDVRKNNWIMDAIQYYYMMDYIETFYPEEKMMGKIAKMKLLKGYNLVSMDFNEQHSYFYMLMARKNIDQPLGFSKDKLLRFNEKIASKAKAGLSFKYLDSYLNNEILTKSIADFYILNKKKPTNWIDFKYFVENNSGKKLDWFFEKIIEDRSAIDYAFDKITKTDDSFQFSLIDKSQNQVPVSVFGLKDGKITSKIWIDKVVKDSIYTLPRNGADKIVINYLNEVIEINQRNNWKSFKRFHIFNKPIKFNFMKDIENPNYNQVLYVPTIEYNYYDGLIPGIRIHNKTLLDKPFMFNINPTFSTNTGTVSGSTAFILNHYNRDSKLFLTRYNVSYSSFHYAPDAYYRKFNPTISFRFRENDFRSNNRQVIFVRYNLVDREKSAFVDVTSENYGVFDVQYANNKSELTKQFSYTLGLQMSEKFGKAEAEVEFRKLFNNNRSINFRLYSGLFLTNNTNSEFFSFGVDRPTDYMFEHNYIGRSESTGLLSQEFIMAEGGFKSKFDTRFANQFITTINAGFNIWNWIEVYGDVGLIKNKFQNPKFIYDSGIRLNLVTNYFELYFPVYSNNGFEIEQPNYNEKIRFVFTLSPQTLINLFTRKWF